MRRADLKAHDILDQQMAWRVLHLGYSAEQSARSGACNKMLQSTRNGAGDRRMLITSCAHIQGLRAESKR